MTYRRRSAQDDDAADLAAKKIKLETESASSASNKAAPPPTEQKQQLSAPTLLWLSRKQKLDRILNLKTENESPATGAVDPQKHANDLFLISKLKELQQKVRIYSQSLRESLN